MQNQPPSEPETRHSERIRLIELKARLFDAAKEIIEPAYHETACDIPDLLVHPAWSKIKNTINPVVMVWELAFVVYPFKDTTIHNNPFMMDSYSWKRRNLIYEIISAIDAGNIKVASGTSYNANAGLEEKAQTKINIEDLAEAFKKNRLFWMYSYWVKVWHLAIIKATGYPQAISPSLEPVDVMAKSCGSSMPIRESQTKPLCWEEIPPDECPHLTQATYDFFELWKHQRNERNNHPISENIGRIVQRNLNLNYELEVHPTYQFGEPRPESTPLSQYQFNEPTQSKTPNPQAKPKEQRQAILNKINDEGWQPLALHGDSKVYLKHWYIKTFFKSEGAFNDRWKELRKQGQIRYASES